MAEITGTNSEKKPAGGLMKLVVVCVLAAGIGGAGMFWFSAHRAGAHAAPAAPNTPPEIKTVLHLESFLVNLSGEDENGFFRVGIDLGMSKPLPGAAAESAAANKFMPMIRDTILGVLGTWNSSALLAPDGKTKLKQQLLAALQKRLPGLGIQEIYFTDFLVQR